jgi:hormone-sensitive lipase
MVRVLVLSDKKVQFGETKGKLPMIERVIIHIHGGGFIAMSPDSHQTYSRKWAKETDSIIFSIDYRLAPASPFPAPLEDIWQAYFWIMTQASKYLNVNPKKVVIVGDSAGGNFTAALTLKCVREKFRIPDGILMGYPALNLNINSFSPSLLIALEDSILRYSFLLICISSYIGTGDSLNPFASPAYATDKDLMDFPVTRIMIAGRDPLRDEALKFAERMAILNKDVRYTLYKHSPHGFWTFGMSHVLDSATDTITKAIEVLNFLLK